jgi:hypothetical protein
LTSSRRRCASSPRRQPRGGRRMPEMAAAPVFAAVALGIEVTPSVPRSSASFDPLPMAASPRVAGSADRPTVAAQPREERCRPGPDRLPARPCRSPMPSPQSSEPRRRAEHLPKPPSGRLKGSSPFDGSLWPDEPPDAGPLEQRQVLDQRQKPRPAAGAPSATGACAMESRGIPWRQLPRMRQRSDRGMSQGGWTAVRLGRYLKITVVAVVYVGRAQVLLGVQVV